MNEILEKFLKLIRENPDLPVVTMVSTECVSGDEYAYYMCKIKSCEINEYAIDEYYGDGCVRFRDDFGAEKLIIEGIAEQKYDGSDEAYEKAEKEAEKMWEKAIVLYIEP